MHMRWLDALLGRKSSGHDRPDGLPRLSWYATHLPRYRLWVCAGEPTAPWIEVQSHADGLFSTPIGQVKLRSVHAYVVTYPGGTVVDQEPSTPRRLPAGTRFLDDVPRVSHLLTRRDFARGREWVEVRFSPCGARPDDRRWHTTTLRNNGLDAVRIVRFGAWRPDGVVYRLNTITGGFFGESDFREWYGLPDGWLEPRREVSDLTAFSDAGTLWAYELETRTGERFWTGASTPGGETG